jgi:hypothetical protein
VVEVHGLLLAVVLVDFLELVDSPCHFDLAHLHAPDLGCLYAVVQTLDLALDIGAQGGILRFVVGIEQPVSCEDVQLVLVERLPLLQRQVDPEHLIFVFPPVQLLVPLLAGQLPPDNLDVLLEGSEHSASRFLEIFEGLPHEEGKHDELLEHGHAPLVPTALHPRRPDCELIRSRELPQPNEDLAGLVQEISLLSPPHVLEHPRVFDDWQRVGRSPQQSADLHEVGVQLQEAEVGLEDPQRQRAQGRNQLNAEVAGRLHDGIVSALECAFLRPGKLRIDADVVDEEDLYVGTVTNGSRVFWVRYRCALLRVSWSRPPMSCANMCIL